MKRGILFLLSVILLTTCGTDRPPEPTLAPTAAPVLTNIPATMERPAETFTPTTAPTSTHTPTPLPTSVGDIGWRKVSGVIYAGEQAPGNELAAALVTCSQFSYVPRDGSCAPYQIITGPDGAFEFDVFVHDTDRITLSADKEGYQPAESQTSGFDCVGVCPLVNLVLEPSP